MSDVGLRPRVVWHLAIDGPLTVKEITERLDGKDTSIRTAVEHVWRSGLLVRRKHPEFEGAGARRPYQYAIRIPEET